MSKINIEYLEKCINTFEKSYNILQTVSEDDDFYELYRNSLVKSFELTLEQSGKLLKKAITPYFASKKQVDQLNFKDIFRHAHKHGLLTLEEAERWLIYRDNRNTTAHDYGEEFAEQTVTISADMIKDAKNLIKVIIEEK